VISLQVGYPEQGLLLVLAYKLMEKDLL